MFDHGSETRNEVESYRVEKLRALNADLLAALKRLLNDTECESCREASCDSYGCDCTCHDDADMARGIARDVIARAEREAK